MPAHPRSAGFALLMLLLAASLLAGAGLRDPQPADEPRFVLAASRMLESGDWLLPRRGSELYADKPPVFMWLLAAARRLTGDWRGAFLLPSWIAALAAQLGATAVDAARGDEAVLAALPHGADVVLECAGVPQTVLQSLRLARRGGTMVLFGVVPQDDRVQISPFDLLTRELRLETAWLNPLTHARAAALISAGTLSLDRMITRTVALDRVPDIVGAAPALGEIKVMMTF